MLNKIFSYPLILLIRFYQKFISPMKVASCKFTPSCSAYFIQALNERGLFYGFYLGVKRILKCSPFRKGGYDPVPKNMKK